MLKSYIKASMFSVSRGMFWTSFMK